MARTTPSRRIAVPERCGWAGVDWGVYGDWLTENGDRRGELIQLERRAERGDAPTVTDQIEAHVVVHQAEWTPDWEPLGTSYQWRHGFISEVTLKDIGDMEHLAWLAELMAEPEGRFIAGVRLRFDEWVKSELAEPLERLDLAYLRHLQVAYHPCGDLVVELLARQARLALTELDLRYAAVSDDGARALASIAQLGCRITALRASCASIAGSRPAPERPLR